MTRLMEVFQAKLSELIDREGLEKDNRIADIALTWKRISDLDCTDEGNLDIEAREAIHDAVDDCTKFLLSLSQLEVLSVLVAHVKKVMEVLADPVSPLNIIVLANKEDSLMSYYFSEIRPAVVETLDPNNLDPNKKPWSKREKEERNTIWITLIFRMLCWLLLHDFDKSDVKIVPSDLKGSRMPVYIG